MKRKKKLTDEELVAIIQKQFEAFRSGGRWQCDCGTTIDHDYSYSGLGNVVMRVICPDCGAKVEKFETRDPSAYPDSLEFEELYNRYKDQLSYCCEKFKYIEDPEDMKGDMAYRFLISVMKYNGSNQFNTYMWTNTRRRFEDFERKNSRACKNNAVECQLCGRMVGAITRLHLMNNKTKAKEGFAGHKILHEKIINDIGITKFLAMGDSTVSCEKKFMWEGNRYSKKQNKIIKSLIVDAYREMFPHYPLSLGNVSISDFDPDTKIEYIEMLGDNRETVLNTDGYYIESETGNDIFIPYEIDDRSKDICKEYACKIAPILHKKFIRNRKRKSFEHTSDKDSLQQFLEIVLPYVAKGYSETDIAAALDIDDVEIDFWIEKMKKSKELKRSFNLLRNKR